MNEGIKITDKLYLSALFPLFVRKDSKIENFIPLQVRHELCGNISIPDLDRTCT